MSYHFSQQGMAALPASFQRPKSSFVRRLIAAKDDPAKARVLRWLTEIDDERLAGFGLTPQDIDILRARPAARLRAA